MLDYFEKIYVLLAYRKRLQYSIPNQETYDPFIQRRREPIDGWNKKIDKKSFYPVTIKLYEYEVKIDPEEENPKPTEYRAYTSMANKEKNQDVFSHLEDNIKGAYKCILNYGPEEPYLTVFFSRPQEAVTFKLMWA